MKQWRFIPLKIRNGSWNMALDEAILEAVIQKKSPYTIRFYKWNPSTASIGRNQSLKDEVDEDFCNKRGFNIVRRITGGGAVFHDSKREITYSIVCPIRFLKNLNAYKVLEQFELINQGIIEALNMYGLESEKGIIHCPAIFLDGKKFSGNAQARRKGYLLQHGTILLKIDPELMYSVLKTPPNVSKNKMVRSVRAKCVGIQDKIQNYEELKFIKFLKNGFEKIFQIDLKEGDFSDYELNLAKKLVEEKYNKDKWLRKYE
ncbi:MAG: lipoate--protein ligase family protein [Promethearchaeota archaeon]|nr:MAG: lipoate--protein ligase family protein [Candidatus Lokiarchaeota archaeon]